MLHPCQIATTVSHLFKHSHHTHMLLFLCIHPNYRTINMQQVNSTVFNQNGKSQTEWQAERDGGGWGRPEATEELVKVCDWSMSTAIAARSSTVFSIPPSNIFSIALLVFLSMVVVGGSSSSAPGSGLPHQALEEALDQRSEGAMGGWIHQLRLVLPWGLASEDIFCHVDEGSWLDPDWVRHVLSSVLHSQFTVSK